MRPWLARCAALSRAALRRASRGARAPAPTPRQPTPPTPATRSRLPRPTDAATPTDRRSAESRRRADRRSRPRKRCRSAPTATTEHVAAFAKNPHTRATPHKDKKPDPERHLLDLPRRRHQAHRRRRRRLSHPTLKGLSGLAGLSLLPRASCPDARTTSFATGVHANTAAVNCLSCHSIHKTAPKSEHLLAKAPGELCATCHTTQTASFQNKPYVHRLDRGGMTCLDCHDPHARRGQPVKMTIAGELPCLNCHSEMRGPVRLRPRHRLGREPASPATSPMAPTTRTCSSGPASSSSASPATRRPEARRRSARSPRRSMT